ncbi:MAG: universal stress protein [Chloroflexi bacterium]|nr:universal stress protein [Chloroflexota bacterium]
MLADASQSPVEVVRVVQTPTASPASMDAVSGMTAFGGATAADLHRIAAEHRWQSEEGLREADLQQALGVAQSDCESLLEFLPPGSTVSVLSTEGDAAEALIAHAHAQQVDLIVMATNSRSKIVEMFVGSVARAVVNAGVAPVTLVRPR